MAPLSTSALAAAVTGSPGHLGMNRLGNSPLIGQGQFCWRCCPVAPRRRRHLAVQSPRAALLDPPPFDPSKLSIEYLPGGRDQAVTAGRRYTLTHNDVTGSLQLSIGRDYNRRQLDGWYTRMLRDEILAEWQDTPVPRSSSSSGGSSEGLMCSAPGAAEGKAVPSLHVYCHVSGEELWPAPPQLRSFIFQREMALVLDTIAHADAALLAEQPALAAAPVYVHLRSDVPALDRVVEWGVLGRRDTWRSARSSMLRSLLSSVLGTLDDGDDAQATDGSSGSWSPAAFSDASSGSWEAADAASSALDSLEQQQQRQRRQQQQGGVADEPSAPGRSNGTEPREATSWGPLRAPAAVASHPNTSPAVGGSSTASSNGVSSPAINPSSSSSSVGAANAVSLRGAGAPTVEARQRLPAAAAEPVPVVVSSRARQR